jgi:hypothetical protein
MSENLDSLQGDVAESAIVDDELAGVDNAAESAAESETPAGEPVESEEGKPEKSEDEEEVQRPKMSRAQKRIVNLVSENHRLQGELSAYKSQLQKPAPGNGPIKREDFADDAEYLDALVEQKIAKREEEQRRKSVTETYTQRLVKAREKYGDWDEAFQSAVRVDLSDDTLEAIYDSEHGPDIAYHLATHPEDAIKLSQMRPTHAARMIGRIEAEIAIKSAGSRNGESVTKQKTQLPPPVKPVSGKGRVETDPSRMTDAQFAQWRREQIKKRGN